LQEKGWLRWIKEDEQKHFIFNITVHTQSELVTKEQIEEQNGGVKDGNPGVYHPWITR